MVDEALVSWRLWHAVHAMRFSLPPHACADGECVGEEILQEPRLWGCSVCLRTHLCTEAADECRWILSPQHQWVCSWTGAERGTNYARYAGYGEWEEKRGERMEDASEEEYDPDLFAELQTANDDFRHAQLVPGDSRERRRAGDKLEEVRGIQRQLNEVRREERSRAAAEKVGRKGGAVTKPAPLTQTEEADEQEEQDEEEDERGFPERDLTCATRSLLPLRRLSSYVRTSVPLAAAFARPRPAGARHFAATTPRWHAWTRRPIRERRRLRLAFAIPPGELVSSTWLAELERIVLAAGVSPLVIDMLARWVALAHVTAPKAAMPPLRVFAAHVLHSARTGMDVRDGLGKTWWIVARDGPLARRAPELFAFPPPASRGGKRKHDDEDVPSRPRYRALFMDGGFTPIQLAEVWDRMANVIRGNYFSAPWFWDWMTLPSRRCYSPPEERVDSMECEDW